MGRAPRILGSTFLFSTVIHLSTLRADLLDIADPWWVVTVGLVLLLSPVYHAYVLSAVENVAADRSDHWRNISLETFGPLVVGELMVNAAVILGGALFLLPGIYIGLRAIYYKQAIVLYKDRPLVALQRSFQLTPDWRHLGQLLAVLGVAYCIPLGVDLLLRPAVSGWWIHLVSIAVSTGFLAFVNIAVTLFFLERVHERGALKGTPDEY